MSTFSSGELGILLGIILVCLYALQRCNLQTPPFFLGLLLGGWLALTFLVGHGGGAPSWLPGLGGGWGGIDPAPLFCTAPSTRTRTVLFVLPSVFEPMEVTIPWNILTEQGHTVQFLTEKGQASTPAAHRMHGIMGGQFMQDEAEVLEQTRIMMNEPSFRTPIAWNHFGSSRLKTKLDSAVKRSAGVVFSGGLAPATNSMLNSKSLRSNVVLPMWSEQRAFGALSRGMLVLAGTAFPGTNTSVLNDRQVATPRMWNERIEHWLLSSFGIAGSGLDYRAVDGGGVEGTKGGKGIGSRTRKESGTERGRGKEQSGRNSADGGGSIYDHRYTSERLAEVLKWPNQQVVYEPMFTLPWLNLHDSSDLRHARVVRDAHLLTAANRKDARLFAHRFVAMLHGAAAKSNSGVARHSTEQACHDDVVLCMPLKIGGMEKQLNFVVHRTDLYPGRLLSKVQKFVRKHGGVYRDGEAQASDVDVLFRSAHKSLEDLGEIKGYESVEEVEIDKK